MFLAAIDCTRKCAGATHPPPSIEASPFVSTHAPVRRNALFICRSRFSEISSFRASRPGAGLPPQAKALVSKIARDDHGDPACPHRDGNALRDERHAEDDPEKVAEGDQQKDLSAVSRNIFWLMAAS